jgi:hypothetical protein
MIKNFSLKKLILFGYFFLKKSLKQGREIKKKPFINCEELGTNQ